MNEEIIKKIEQAKYILEECLGQLNSKNGKEVFADASQVLSKNKIKTLREIIKGREFNNGPEKIAIIVGYHEKILKSLINKDNLKKEWSEAKMEGSYKTNLFTDASGVYVRIQPNGMCDLTQTGEDFFEKFIKNEPTKTTPK